MKKFKFSEKDIVRILNMQDGVFASYVNKEEYNYYKGLEGKIIDLGYCKGRVIETIEHKIIESIYMVKIKILAKLKIIKENEG